MTLKPDDVENFKTLCHAAEQGMICLMECRDRKTGEYRAVICALNTPGSGVDGVDFIPLGHLATGNPFEDYKPPDPEDPDGYLIEESRS